MGGQGVVLLPALYLFLQHGDYLSRAVKMETKGFPSLPKAFRRKKGLVCGVGQERLGPSYFFISLVLGPLNSLLWYVPS